MIRFRCPQCGRGLRAGPNHADKSCECPACGGTCGVPKSSGGAAVVVCCSVRPRAVAVPITAFQLPPVCLGCGRDAEPEPLKITRMSHRKSFFSCTGDLAAVAGFELAGITGYAIARGVTRAASGEPFPLFVSVPSCGECGARDLRDVRLASADEHGVTIEGVPSRFAVAALAFDRDRLRRQREKVEQEAQSFEDAMRGESPGRAPAADGGFDWSRLT